MIHLLHKCYRKLKGQNIVWRAIFLTQIQWNFLYTKGAATSRFLSDVAAFYCSLFIPVKKKKKKGGEGHCLLLWCNFILRALIIRLIEVGLETVLRLTCYHCLGVCELFSDLVTAQCCLWLQSHLTQFLAPLVCSLPLKCWNKRVMQDM